MPDPLTEVFCTGSGVGFVGNSERRNVKQFIRNRHGQRVCVVQEGSVTPGALAFVMHGLSGDKTELHIRAMAEAFLESGYTVVTFDTTNTFGESDGQFEDATLTGYYQDLEDVVSWASRQEWYVEPFVLAGHSVGGICIGLFAQRFPHRVKGLAPISTVVSGDLTLKTPLGDPRERYLDEWRRDGYLITGERNGVPERLKWACMEDRLQYSLIPDADKLVMPVLMSVGSEDDISPVAHQQILFDLLPEPKEFHLIGGATHIFEKSSQREELKAITKTWITTLP